MQLKQIYGCRHDVDKISRFFYLKFNIGVARTTINFFWFCHQCHLLNKEKRKLKRRLLFQEYLPIRKSIYQIQVKTHLFIILIVDEIQIQSIIFRFFFFFFSFVHFYPKWKKKKRKNTQSFCLEWRYKWNGCYDAIHSVSCQKHAMSTQKKKNKRLKDER